MTHVRLADHLGHMLEAVELACSYVDGMSREQFLADTRTQQAVIMNLVIIGEIAAKLLRDHGPFLASHPSLPWKSMKGMRNRIAQGYFAVNL